ncbi:MAG: multidrug efflux MFS transporter [Chloroflexi bacterium]|uniref:Multidrug efflux MFS transporter n=1 Tax=Candidatus Chlorohelix allophototropha TaxID=3003348 RepID=A0A8T7MA60_9CHLR|nr:multidrug efflux MFS transporter [Chloroflexota bacterium]WJW69006.1 multidrug efflux MFS transporter [Chloroflexota bacterium L227-S17]
MKKIPYRYAVALSAALGLFMAVLDNTIVNVSLTAMLKSFSDQDSTVTINTIQWVITGYFLAQAAVIPVAGYFSHRYGLRRIFLFALAMFTLGSFLCGFSHELDHLFGGGGVPMLIIFRVFQGLGGGMLFPLAISISFNVFPPADRAKSSAVVAIPVLLAPTLGPTIGGLLVDSPFDWPSIFFINIPVGLLAMFLIARLLKPDFGRKPMWASENWSGGTKPADSTAPEAVARPASVTATRLEKFDFLGLLLSISGTILVVYSFSLVSDTREGSITPQTPTGEINGWGYWLVWVMLVTGLAILGIFSAYELRRKDPVLDLRVFKSRDFTVATLMTWVVRAVIFGSFFILPLFLERFKNMSAVLTGLSLMPQGIGAAIGIISGSRIYDIVGPRIQVIMGIIALTISSIMLMNVSPESDGWSFVLILLIRGIGFGWSNLPLQTVALSRFAGPSLPKVSSLYNATAQIFSSIGVAVLTTLFVTGLTERVTSGVKAAAASGQRPDSQAIVLNAAAGSMGNVFTFVTIGTALTIFLALLLPKKSIKQEQIEAARKGVAAAQEETPVVMME